MPPSPPNEDSEQDETQQPSPAALFSGVGEGSGIPLLSTLTPAGDGACSWAFGKKIMLRKYRWILGMLVVGAICTAYFCAKAFYFGWELRNEASFGGYQVKSFKTVSSIDPRAFMARDGDRGYYRIFDERGRKVFELFSDSLNFDIVLSSKDGVEFQLDSGTCSWTLPKK